MMTDTYHMRILYKHNIGLFVTNMFAYADSDPTAFRESSVWSWCVAANSRLSYNESNFKDTHKWLHLPVKENGMVEFERVKIDMISPMFKHGGGTIYCIRGPVFNKAERD